MSITKEEDVHVGWEQDLIETFPPRNDVYLSTRIQLVTWLRFLRDAVSREEFEIVDLIRARLRETFPVGGVQYEVVHPKHKIEDID